jgi:hypothetical protein
MISLSKKVEVFGKLDKDSIINRGEGKLRGSI